MSSSNSPCAACKCLRRKCTQECVFAPYFPPDNPQKFTNVHKVFGASNVSKLLNDLNASQREDAVNSLAYEAEFRLRDPVYGCVGLISMLQTRLRQVQHEVATAKKELAAYIGPSALLPILDHTPPPLVSGGVYQTMPPSYNVAQQPMMMGLSQIMMTAYDQQQQQQHQQQQQQQNELLRFSGGFDEGVTATGFNQMAMQPSLALGAASYETGLPYNQHVQEHLQHPQEMLMQQNNLLQQPRAKSEEGRSIVHLG